MGRLLRRLLLLVVSLVVIALGLLVFATTEAGFRVLLRPLLAKQGVEVAEGRVGLGGTVEARQVRWNGGSLESLALSLDPWSLLPGRRPRVHALTIEALSADLPPADPEAASEQDPEAGGFRIPGFEVAEAAVTIAILRQLDASGAPTWQVGPAELSLSDWRPGHDEGQLEARADFALHNTEPARSGSLKLSAQLDVPRGPAEPHSFISSQLEVSLSPDELLLRAEPEGAVGESVELRGPLELSRAGAPLLEGGQLELLIEGGATALGVKIGRVPLGTLFAALGRPAPSRAVAALALGLDAQLKSDAETGRIAVERFALEQRRPGAAPVKLAVQGSVLPGAQPELDLEVSGPGADGGEGSAHVGLADGEFDVKIVSLDLTELAAPWLEADEKQPPKQAPEPKAPSDAEVVARIEIGALRYRQVLIRDARASLKQKGSTFALEIPSARLGEGKLAGRFDSAVADGRRSLSWKLDAEQLDLSEIFHTLDPKSEGQLAGKLDLSSEATSTVPGDADPFDALEGVLRFKLKQAQAQGLPFQEFMASKLAVDGLASLAFNGAQGDIPIRKGRAIFEDLYVDGNAANFKVRGELSARDIDLSVNPRLGPRLASEVAPRLANSLFETASGALALPVVFTVKGDWGDTRFLMLPAPPSLVGDVLGTTTGALTGAARFLMGIGEDPAAESGPAPEQEPAPESEPAPEQEPAPAQQPEPGAEAPTAP